MSESYPWKIEFYRDERGRAPVQDFIEGLQPAIRRKVGRNINVLEREGDRLKMPLARPIAGYGFWELRVQMGRNIARIFYFLVTGRRIVFLHGFIKKTQAIPRTELEIAAARRTDWLRRDR